MASVKESIPAMLPSHTLYTAVVRDAAAKYKAVPNQTCDALLTKATDQFCTPRAIAEGVRLQLPAQHIPARAKHINPFYA